MKLASIILPRFDNNGLNLFDQHQQLKHDLLQRWGGYTAVEVNGAWMGNGRTFADTSVRYEVAMERADVVAFRELARTVAHYCRQDCVMLVTPCGDVEFVKPENKLPDRA